MRYLLFVFERHYPAGGWDDLIGSFNSVEEAVTYAESREVATWGEVQVVDLETREVVKWGETYHSHGAEFSIDWKNQPQQGEEGGGE